MSWAVLRAWSQQMTLRMVLRMSGQSGPEFAVTAGSGFFGFGWVDSYHHLWGDTYSDGNLELHEPLKPSGISSS